MTTSTRSLLFAFGMVALFSATLSTVSAAPFAEKAPIDKDSETDFIAAPHDDGDDIVPQCEFDFNVDGFVDNQDLQMLIVRWSTPVADMLDDQEPDVNDLLELLANWGTCS